MLFSSANFLAAGFAASAVSVKVAAGVDSTCAADVGALATAPASILPISSCDKTTSPSCFITSVNTPSAAATTSKTVLSVSISTISSSRLTDSPTCLCQVAIEPSSTDSGNWGALISIAIVFP